MWDFILQLFMFSYRWFHKGNEENCDMLNHSIFLKEETCAHSPPFLQRYSVLLYSSENN